MSYDFQTTAHGKWILAGEHAVLRNHPAIVFPFNRYKLSLSYKNTCTPLQIILKGSLDETIRPFLSEILSEGLRLLDAVDIQLSGLLLLENHIPPGRGLGASAALCVVLTRWFSFLFNHNYSLETFAQTLENVFHGQSSGLDITGSSQPHGVLFQKGTVQSILHPSWQPYWYLSATPYIGKTAQCIHKVLELWKKNPHQADQLDIKMSESVHYAWDGLQHQDFNKLTHAITLAHDCFEAWDLLTPELVAHIHLLKNMGAVAVKPTGSGGGGYLLSLWDHPIDHPELILCEIQVLNEAVQPLWKTPQDYL